MATRSNILAWETPWTKELHGLQFMGSQRVGHSLRARAHTHTHTHSSYFFNPPVKLSEVFSFTKILQIHHLFLRYLVLAIMKNLLFYFFIVRKDFKMKFFCVI